MGATASGDYRSAYHEALARESALQRMAYAVPGVLGALVRGGAGRAGVILTSTANLVYSLVCFADALRAGVLLLSIPLLMMALAGAFGLRLGFLWEH